MNKGVVKNFAIWARKSLIKEIKDKLTLIGINKDEIKENLCKDESFGEYEIGNFKTYKISKEDLIRRQILIKKIQEQGYENIIEQVSYIWFNRITAIRFMEVNEYLPSGIKVLS